MHFVSNQINQQETIIDIIFIYFYSEIKFFEPWKWVHGNVTHKKTTKTTFLSSEFIESPKSLFLIYHYQYKAKKFLRYQPKPSLLEWSEWVVLLETTSVGPIHNCKTSHLNKDLGSKHSKNVWNVNKFAMIRILSILLAESNALLLFSL